MFGLRSALFVLTAFALAALSGCSDSDVGRCCRAIDGTNPEIPVASDPDQTTIRRDPDFDCSALTCVAYRGSAAYCTRDCVDERDCPDGFACRTVLLTDTGTRTQIQMDDKFCVRDEHQCTE